MNIIPGIRHIPLTLFAWGISAGLSHAATVIYSDDFTTGTSAALNTQAPMERPGTQTWRAASVYTKDITGGVVNSSGSGSANLSFPTFDLTQIYTLTARVYNNEAASSANWVGIGWTTQTTNTNAWNVAGTGTYWMLWRGNDELRGFAGAGAVSAIGPTGVTAAGVGNVLDMRVILDLPANTVSFLYKNPDATIWTQYGPTTALTTSLRDNINSVGFTTLSGNTGVQSFELTAIPEPSAALLGGLGLLALMRRRRG